MSMKLNRSQAPIMKCDPRALLEQAKQLSMTDKKQ